MATEIRVPTLGESVTEATVGQWYKQAGDAVTADEPLVELETDKVTVEVPAPASGVLSEIVVKAGDTVAVGSVLGAIAEGDGKAKPAPVKAAAATPQPAPAPVKPPEPPKPPKMQPAALEREPSPREEVSDSGNGKAVALVQPRSKCRRHPPRANISPRPGFRRQASWAQAAAGKF